MKRRKYSISDSNYSKEQCSGYEINNFGSGSSNLKSGISDPDLSVTWDGEKKVVNFGYGIMKTQMGW